MEQPRGTREILTLLSMWYSYKLSGKSPFLHDLYDDKEHTCSKTQLVEAGVTPHYAKEKIVYLIHDHNNSTASYRSSSLTPYLFTGRGRQRSNVAYREACHIPGEPKREGLCTEEEQMVGPLA